MSRSAKGGAGSVAGDARSARRADRPQRGRTELALALLPLVLSCAALQRPTAPSAEDVLAAALPGVVLVVSEGRGNLTYGAGVLLSPTRVLTNLHVVGEARSVAVLPFLQGRPLYTPLDGGLARVLFENRAALVGAGVLRVDPNVDLAVLEAEAPLGDTVLAARAEPVRPGERVFALGHPKEALWSFTSGVVSATPVDAIQHDAPINQGNSGGALIDERGRLLGINTFKLLGGAESLSFARPLALGLALARDEPRRVPLDLSTPERAFETCARAVELRSEDAVSCTDVGAEVEFQRAHQFPSRPSKRTAELWEKTWPFDPAEAERALLEQLRARLGRRPVGPWAEVPEHSYLRKLLAQKEVLDPFAPVFADRGIKGFDFGDALGSEARLVKLGQRVVARHEGDANTVWLKVSGRNVDGSSYEYSRVYLKSPVGWRTPLRTRPGELALRPPGWPVELYDAALLNAAYQHQAEVLGQGAAARPAVGLLLAVEPGAAPNRPAVVAAVHPRGPTAAAGVKAGDVVTAIAGQQVTSLTAASVISELEPGTEVTMLLARGPVKVKVSTLGALPSYDVAAAFLWDLDDEEGVEVDEGGMPGGPLKAGDVVMKLGGRRVVNLIDVSAALLTHSGGPLAAEIVRRGARLTVSLPTTPSTPSLMDFLH